MTKDEKEVAKLEKMKEIQDTVKALRKQLEDIEKKDTDDEGSEHNKNKDDDDEEEETSDKHHSNVQLGMKQKGGVQILAEKESISNTTSNVTSEEKQAKFDRFVKVQK